MSGRTAHATSPRAVPESGSAAYLGPPLLPCVCEWVGWFPDSGRIRRSVRIDGDVRRESPDGTRPEFKYGMCGVRPRRPEPLAFFDRMTQLSLRRTETVLCGCRGRGRRCDPFHRMGCGLEFGSTPYQSTPFRASSPQCRQHFIYAINDAERCFSSAKMDKARRSLSVSKRTYRHQCRPCRARPLLAESWMKRLATSAVRVRSAPQRRGVARSLALADVHCPPVCGQFRRSINCVFRRFELALKSGPRRRAGHGGLSTGWVSRGA